MVSQIQSLNKNPHILILFMKAPLAWVSLAKARCDLPTASEGRALSQRVQSTYIVEFSVLGIPIVMGKYPP